MSSVHGSTHDARPPLVPRTHSGAPGDAERPAAARRRGRRRDTVPGMLMVAPAMGGLLVFLAVPFVAAIVMSFFNVHVGQTRPPRFVGLTYYTRLFTDPVYSGPFLRSLLNNCLFAVVVVPTQTALALGLAVLLNRKLRGVAVFRTFFFMPVVFPMALVAVIWRLILERSDSGLLNATVHLVSGGLAPAHDWLGSGATAMGSVILISIWQGVGFQMVIILAALQEIPGERYEAAQLDRANAWQRFVHITVPGIRNTLVFVVLVTTIYAFRLYDQVYILIKTADANQKATQTVLYQATSAVFEQNNFSLASAITVIFFVIIVAVTLVQRLLLRQTSEG
jgi:multiple sugar transport system permease protein